MARSITQIFNSIITQKQAQPALNALTSNSVTAVWKLWAYVTAVCIFALETLWDKFKVEVEAIVAAAQPGTDEWYSKRAIEFQYGDNLQIINNKLTYATIDPAKQIIKRVSVTEADKGESLIKVAKLSGSELVALSTPELVAFAYYIDRLEFAGSTIHVVSQQTDLLKLALAVYYNPLYDLEGATGLKARVISAVKDYLLKLPFNGTLVRNDLEFALRQVIGVADAVISNAEAKANAGAYATIPRTYQTVAGYIKIDPAFSLESIIQYLPV